jgi:hypothetical protein
MNTLIPKRPTNPPMITQDQAGLSWTKPHFAHPLQNKLAMTNQLSVKALFLTWMALAVTLSNGCRQNAASDSSTDATANRAQQIARGLEPAQGSPQGLTANPSASQGTGDLGGGNGLNGKLFESYIIDPTESRAWIEEIKPVADQLKELSIQEAESEDGRKHLREQPDVLTAAAKLLKWYVAPVNLAAIDKSTLGIDFVQDPIQQMALQTKGEVWINKTFFDGLDTKEQARLMMHETVMSLFQMQFLEIFDLCVRARLMADCSVFDESRLGGGHPQDPSSALPKAMREALVKWSKPQTRRQLTASDYSSIRRVTDTLFRRQKFSSYKEVNNYLLRAGFDSRIFGEAPFESSDSDAKAAANQIPSSNFPDSYMMDSIAALQLLKSASLSGHLPKHCRFDDLGQAQAECSLRIGEIALKRQAQNLPYAIADLEIEERPTVPGIAPRKEKMRLVVLSYSTGSRSDFAYSTAKPASFLTVIVTPTGLPIGGRSVEALREGQTVWSLQVALAGTADNPQIFSYSLVPMVVTQTGDEQALIQMISPELMPAFVAAGQARLPGPPMILGLQAAQGPGPTRSQVPNLMIDLANRE